jgi:hypothetical protein
MASFKSVRDLLLIGFDEGLLDEEEFLLLYQQYTSLNAEYPYTSYPAFDLELKDEVECKTEFRVEKNDIPGLADTLGIPEIVKCSQGTICGREEALCILLKRFAYPCRYSDLIPTFGRPVPELAMINYKMISLIFYIHGHRLTEWNHQILHPEALETYATAVSNKGAALTNCFGFVDGTVRQICRPGKNQRVVYNGHKRVHALKFQSVALPNGIIANLYGPVGKFLVNQGIIFNFFQQVLCHCLYIKAGT